MRSAPGDAARLPVHARGRSQSGPSVDVTLDVVDALSVGHSIRTLVRGRKLPPGTAEVYDRVANQMIAAARLAMASR